MRLGYDLCEVVSEDIVGLLKSFKENHITVFQLTKVDDCTYRFYLPIYQRIMVRKYHLTIIKSVGILYYLILIFYRKLSIVGVVSFAVTVILCNQFIFRVEIIGNNPSTTKLVNQVLAENHIDVGDKKRTYQQLNDIYDDLKEKIESGMPVWGTCAGMILLAKSICNDDTVHLGTMDIEVKRNAYGRQLGSFNTKSNVKGIGEDIEMVFIRAPYIENVDDNVEVLSVVDNNIVAAKENNMLVTSFHPELTSDFRVHKYFLKMVEENNKGS